MGVVRDFDAAPEGEEEAERCEFKLGGRVWSCRRQTEIPFSLMNQLLSLDTADVKAAAMQIGSFFKAVLVKDQAEDFAAMLAAEDSELTIGKLEPLIEYISVEVFGRPTTPPAGSANGRRPIATTSAAG